MKKFLLILLSIVSVTVAQKVTVVEDVPITSADEGAFFYPVVSPDGNEVLFTSDNRKGLWFKNLVSGDLLKISDAPSAGYQPGFEAESNSIIYREDSFVNGMRYSSLIKYNVSANQKTILAEGIRDLRIIENDGIRFYLNENGLNTIENQNSLKKVSNSDPVVSVENAKIALYINGVKQILDPIGNGNYIWPSLSPEKSKILFTCLGKGTYICNLEGKVISKIGFADAPSWSPDGNWLVFMKDIDDGKKVIASDIYIVDLISGNYFNITESSGRISMFPKWGNSNTEIFYNTVEGQIRKIKLNYE